MALLHGDVVGAFVNNPLAALAGIVFIVGGAVAPLWALADGRTPILPTPLPIAARVALAAVLAVTWAYLIAVGR